MRTTLILGPKHLIYYLTKIAITTALIVAISEIARRSTFIGALFASIPLVSALAMLWLYVDTGDVHKVRALSTSVFWLVPPSLVFFLVQPLLLKQGMPFYPSIGLAIAATIGAYWLMVMLLDHYGFKL